MSEDDRKWCLFWPRNGGNQVRVTLIKKNWSGDGEVLFTAFHGSGSYSSMRIAQQSDFFGSGGPTEGSCWRYAARTYSKFWAREEFPTEFDLQAIIAHPEVVVLDENGEEMTSANKKIAAVNNSLISNEGRWISDAGRYSNLPNGETGGPSGLRFL